MISGLFYIYFTHVNTFTIQPTLNITPPQIRNIKSIGGLSFSVAVQ